MKRPPVRYFRLQMGRLTIGELWRACQGNIVAFMLVLPSKIGLHLIKQPYSAAIEKEWIHINPDDIPRTAVKRLNGENVLLKAEGFVIIAYGAVPLLEETRVQYSILMLSSDEFTRAVIHYVKDPNNVTLVTGLTSRCSDGSYIITISGRQAFNQDPNRGGREFISLPTDQLCRHHTARLEQAKIDGKNFEQYTPQDGINETVRLGQEGFEYLFRRGVFVEIPDGEVEDIFWRRDDDHDD